MDRLRLQSPYTKTPQQIIHNILDDDPTIGVALWVLSGPADQSIYYITKLSSNALPQEVS